MIRSRRSFGSLPNPYKAAQRIRDNAGVPSTETVGPRYADADIGCDETVTFTERTGQTTISAITDLAALSPESGDGLTWETRYIIRNQSWTETASNNQCISWNDAGAADYFAEFVNCRTRGYVGGQIIRAAAVGTGKFKFTNWTCYWDDVTGNSTANTGLAFTVGTIATSLEFDRLKCGKTGGIAFTTSNTYTGTFWVHDSILDDSLGTWPGSNSAALKCNQAAGSGTIIFDHNRVRSINKDSFAFGIDLEDAPASLTITNNYWEGIGDNGVTFASGVVGGNASGAGPMTFKYNRTVDLNGYALYIQRANSHDVSYNDFGDTPANQRICYYSDTDVQNVRMHHNKATKTTGTANVAVNECFMAADCPSVEIDNNWVTQCTEDAFELVRPQAGCSIHDNVGDSVLGQVCDVFEPHAVSPAAASVYNIYGSVATLEGVSVGGGAHTVSIWNIHVASPQSTVRLNGAASNCTVYGPIANSGSGVLFDLGTGGSDYTGTGSTIGGVIGVESIPDGP